MYIDHLETRALIRITGDEAEHFLENLITCKITDMVEGDCRFGALLTPQGKILFDFFISADQNGYVIDIERSMAGDFQKRLTFYKLRAKVEISTPEEQTVTVFWWGEDYEYERSFRDPRHEAIGFRSYSSKTFEGEKASYDAHRIELGIPQGGSDFNYGDAYPHETLMDQFGGVDFKKGCYVGQEVVSRMQHKTEIRKRILQVTSSTTLPATGSPITADGKPAGVMGSTHNMNGLALVRMDRIQKASEVLSEGVALQFKIPQWADFNWPETN